VIETNIVLADVSGTGIEPSELVSLLAHAGVRALERDTARVRFVTHRLIGDDEVERAVAIVAETVERHAVPPVELPPYDDSWEAELDDLPED
jgi:threonine aldolase